MEMSFFLSSILACYFKRGTWTQIGIKVTQTGIKVCGSIEVYPKFEKSYFYQLKMKPTFTFFP